MARIFVSHSSQNNAEAAALGDWLTSEGWDDLFLDLDTTRGIAAGERWERSLYAAASRCEAVLFLISKAWLASSWCLRELNLAQKLNKRTFGILIENIPVPDLPGDLTSTWQLVNLAGGSDHVMIRTTLPDGGEAHVTFSQGGLARLKVGLTRAGLDARFFAWPPEGEPDRPPYRGLKPLEAEDAGIFFGREAPTIEALDRLRGLSEAAPPRVLAILGASGAGKSSFLRAGLIPRLARDDRNFLVLPIVRPERAALTGESGLVRSIEEASRAHGLRQSRAAVAAAVQSGAGAIEPLLAALAGSVPVVVDDSEPRPPCVVLAIDQGEELFLGEGAGEASAFLDIVSAIAARPNGNVIVVFTIRSDAFERLQTASALEGVTLQTLSLPPMPRGAYQTVIEGPVRRLADSDRALAIEPALTEALLADVEAGGGKDALPLLAFTLERLYLEYGGGGRLTHEQYRTLGGIRGSIEAAVEDALRAADADPAVPRDRTARLALLRRALIPWLAGIDTETGAPRRRVARLSEIPAEARPLVEHLIAARLLATDVSPDTGERTIEPAHEALLRQWGLLQGWLEEDFATLSTLEGVKRASRDWAANDRDAGWLGHTAGRLDDAEALKQRDDLAHFLDATDLAYLAEARAADTARRNRELEEARKLAEAQSRVAAEQRQVARRTRLGLIAASILAVVAIGAAVFGFQKAQEATEQTRIAEAKTAEAVSNETVGLAGLSTVAVTQVRPRDALQLAVAAWPRTGNMDRPKLRRATESLSLALASYHEPTLSGHFHTIYFIAFSPEGRRVATASGDETARVWDAATGEQLAIFEGHTSYVVSVNFDPSGKRVVSGSLDDTVRIWDSESGNEVLPPLKLTSSASYAAFSHDGTRVVTAAEDGNVSVWDAGLGTLLLTIQVPKQGTTTAEFSPDDRTIVTASQEGTIRLWDAHTGAAVREFEGHTSWVNSARFSPDGTRLVSGADDGSAAIWDVATGNRLFSLEARAVSINSAAFTADGKRVVTVSSRGVARMWDARTGEEIGTIGEPHEFVWLGRDRAWRRPYCDHVDRRSVSSVEFPGTGRDFKTIARVGYLVESIGFSPDGKLLAAVRRDGSVRILNAQTGAEVQSLDGHNGYSAAASFSPDGRHMATAQYGHVARIWDIETGTGLVAFSGHTDSVNAIAFSPDGSRVVTASDDLTAGIWDSVTGKQLLSLAGHLRAVKTAAFSPDGSRVVTASADKTAIVWDAVTGQSLVVLKGHFAPVAMASFSPDGTRILTASSDGTARLWDAGSGQQLLELHSDAQPISSANFSADGNRIVTTADDYATTIWDSATGAPLAVMMGRLTYAYSAAFSSDGTQIAIGDGDGGVALWDISGLESGDGFAVACARLGGNTDMTAARTYYGLGEIHPICGDNAPVAVDWHDLK